MDTVECRKVIAVWLAVVLLTLMVLTSCGGVLEVGMETTPTTDAAATATIAALDTENARLATQVATLAVPTPALTPKLGKLAYVQGGDIWVKTLPDGEPQRLTTDGRNSQPRWSPSGEWLAFRKDAQVWLVRADGNDLHPLWKGGPVSTFAWSPAEDRLAYAAGSGILRLETIHADGTDPATLIPPSICASGMLGRIAWNPGGTWIAYEWQEGQTYQGLWKVSADGKQRTELYVSGMPEKGEAVLAGWISDGSHVLFWQGDILSASMLADGVPLYALPTDGGEPTRLADAVLYHADFVAPHPADTGKVALVAGGGRGTWWNKILHVVDASSEEEMTLTLPDQAVSSPEWSPDSQCITYVAMPDEDDLVGGDTARQGLMERRIWVTSADGSNQRPLTDDPAYRDERPLWSADGTHLLFARMDAEGRASLWLIPAAGGEARQVVDEVTPLPGPASGWFGYYGHVEWDRLFDWWRGPAKVTEGVTVPTSGTDVVMGCADIYPGLPGCLRDESLVGGRLAFVDSRPPSDGCCVVIDLEKGGVWTLGKSPATLIGWSPSGEYLLIAEGEGYSVYGYDGTAISSYEDLPVPPFWASPDAFPGARDWLAVPTGEGALLAVSFPEGETHQILPPGSLGKDGRGIVRWSRDGWLAWSLNTDQLVEASRFDQMLYVRPAEEGTEVTTWRLSDDIRETYYEIIDWVPGSHLILAGRGMMAVSLWVDGVPLVTINADTGEITDLGVSMLLTPEAYTWSPTKPSLLALAEGGGRFLFANKRLALLDVLVGEPTYLMGQETVVFAPAWSPDGTLLAYAAVPASPDAEGNGTTLEHTLDRRAIYVVNPQSGETHQLTDPGDAIDGWPQWSADGTRLLYTRQHDGHTDVRVVSLDGSSDELLVTGLADPTCYYGGCGWRQMLTYHPGP